MAPRPARRRAQRGLALLGLLAVIVMVFAWILTSRLNAANSHVALDREHNARVMSRAKQALIGYVAQKAAMAGENNPGSLPCPEAPGDFNVPGQEGTANGNCTLPAVGRLPWRTIGVEKLVDAAGEPLWYVVSPGWAVSGTQPVINSDTTGQLTVDGEEAVALIIAPGPVLSAQACGGSSAWAQARPTTGAPDLRNYLECENATFPADSSFVRNKPGQVFNDQILRVTTADVMPGLEAAIADRMQRQIAPVIQAAAYTDAQWPAIPAGIPVYPYPVPMSAVPSGDYEGAPGTSQGLLPFNQIRSGCVAPPPCTPIADITGAVALATPYYGSIEPSPSCTTSATEILCEGQYREDSDPWRDVRIEMAATFPVAMGFHVLASNPLSYMYVEARNNGSSGPWLTPTPTIVSIGMNNGATAPAGSVTIRFRATLPNIEDNGWGTIADFRFRIDRAVFSDHALLNKNDPTLGWFVRNKWYENTYYAAHKRHTADVLALSAMGCSTDPSYSPSADRCLSFNAPDSHNVRALLVLAGRTLPTQSTRPTSNRLDYVEFENGDNDRYFEQRWPRMSKTFLPSPIYAPSNDRVVLVDPLPSAALPSQVDPVTSRIVVTSQP